MNQTQQGDGVLIVGATSAIAQECAKLFANDGARFFLVARRSERLEAVAGDLQVRGARAVSCHAVDVTDASAHGELVRLAEEMLGGIDYVLVAHGTLSDQARCDSDPALVLQELSTNAGSTMSLLTLLAGVMERRRQGCIAVISSVAGDRGRRSNYVYGASKSAVTVFLQGLRGRLHDSGVSVVTIKPGPVDTPMTAHMPRTALFVSAASVGRAVHDAMVRRREVVYAPWYWRWIMLVLRAIPESLFKRFKF